MVEPGGSDAEADPELVPRVEPDAGPVADPDQAWKALSLVNDWIKHAETKVGATLAASSAVGVMLYNLVKNQTAPGVVLSICAVSCVIAIVGAGISAIAALIPRLSIIRKRKAWKLQKGNEALGGVQQLAVPEDPVNLLFFSNIARYYKDDSPSYVEILSAMTADPEKLTRQIAHQVHANATVSYRKFVWADRAVRFLAVALCMLAIVATIVGSRG